jgi:LacI family transcriptional regulator
MLDAELDIDGLAERITDNVDAARMAAHEQIDAGTTGFVCASDTMAMGVLRAFDERSMHAGSDVGVVGFDDSAAAQVTGLSSVRQPLEQVAVELVGLLRSALDGLPTPATGTVLTPTLVVRTSSVRTLS